MCDYHRSAPAHPSSVPFLQLFFDGVEALIAANTRPDEVCYRMDFSKTVLRECIQKYSGKEVSEGCACIHACLAICYVRTNMIVTDSLGT